MLIDQLQTARRAMQQIMQGRREWTALGDFGNYWYSYATDRRDDLVIDPLPDIEENDVHAQQWAAFIGGYVEALCGHYGVPCPSWTQEKRYFLTEPFFVSEAVAQKPHLHEGEIAQTPEPLKRRNVFCAKNAIFSTKWEIAEFTKQWVIGHQSAKAG